MLHLKHPERGTKRDLIERSGGRDGPGSQSSELRTMTTADRALAAPSIDTADCTPRGALAETTVSADADRPAVRSHAGAHATLKSEGRLRTRGGPCAASLEATAPNCPDGLPAVIDGVIEVQPPICVAPFSM